MTGKEIAAKLREALALMNDSGAHWVQGTSMTVAVSTGEKKYCSIGAIRMALTDDPWVMLQTYDEDGTTRCVEEEVTGALVEFLPRPKYDDQSLADQIVVWNDDDERRWSDIEEAFTKAAEAAEQRD